MDLRVDGNLYFVSIDIFDCVRRFVPLGDYITELTENKRALDIFWSRLEEEEKVAVFRCAMKMKDDSVVSRFLKCEDSTICQCPTHLIRWATQKNQLWVIKKLVSIPNFEVSRVSNALLQWLTLNGQEELAVEVVNHPQFQSNFDGNHIIDRLLDKNVSESKLIVLLFPNSPLLKNTTRRTVSRVIHFYYSEVFNALLQENPNISKEPSVVNFLSQRKSVSHEKLEFIARLLFLDHTRKHFGEYVLNWLCEYNDDNSRSALMKYLKTFSDWRDYPVYRILVNAAKSSNFDLVELIILNEQFIMTTEQMIEYSRVICFRGEFGQYTYYFNKKETDRAIEILKLSLSQSKIHFGDRLVDMFCHMIKYDYWESFKLVVHQATLKNLNAIVEKVIQTCPEQIENLRKIIKFKFSPCFEKELVVHCKNGLPGEALICMMKNFNRNHQLNYQEILKASCFGGRTKVVDWILATKADQVDISADDFHVLRISVAQGFTRVTNTLQTYATKNGLSFDIEMIKEQVAQKHKLSLNCIANYNFEELKKLISELDVNPSFNNKQQYNLALRFGNRNIIDFIATEIKRCRTEE